ncbi:MAG: CBS domain-containing protein [Gammaproteobacteria bacterium]|nr:MAG: CBS domain-containing protein [Gammaproteobacteria bacterium]
MDSISNITVSDIMQREVLAVESDWPLDQLARFLTDHQISGAPVIAEKGNLVGVVSLTDIVRHDGAPEGHAPEHSTHEYYLHGLELQVGQQTSRAFHIEEESSVTVQDIMTPMIFEISESAGIQQAADTMVKGHIHRLFVTRKGRIAGIVTALDILASVREQSE